MYIGTVFYFTMENYIPISYINDFIFCPRSIYNHQMYHNRAELIYQGEVQTEGKDAHQKIDAKKYSDRKNILQNYEVFSNQYKLFGKIDTFDTRKGLLTERKNNIKTIYDGFVFQLYAQYFGLIEMGYQVSNMQLYDFSKNKTYPIPLPINDLIMLEKFEATIEKLNSFSLLNKNFEPNKFKCEKCIYNLLCDASLC